MEKQQKNHDLLGLALSDSFEMSANSSTVVQHQKNKPVMIKAGQKIKQYSIVSKLGEGGMGVVYKAFDHHLQREVAIKVLCNDEGQFHKLLKEAKSIAQLNHPNIVQVYEVCDEYPYFFAMELINGISLAEFIQLHSKKLKKHSYYRKITNIFILVARALEFAHSKGIIHRDLKPENIMLDRELQPKIMDFGIARVASDVKKTLEDDNFAGTPMYMSPEQAKGSKITKSTDIYSLGVTLYESLTSMEPFRGDSVFNVIFQIIHDDPIPPRRINSEIPPDLQAICLQCLQKNTKKRYLSMKFLARDLKNFLELKPISAKTPGKIELAYKLFLRTKEVSLTLISAFIIILILTLFYVNSLHQHIQEKKDALVLKEKALTDLTEALADVTEAEKARKIATIEKERIQSEKNYDLLKVYYEVIQNHIRKKNFLAAQNSLKQLKDLYSQTKFSNAERYLEYRYLAKRAQPYTKKLSAEIPKNIKIYHANDKIITVGEKGTVSLHRQQGYTLDKYREIRCGKEAHSSSLSRDGKYLAILYSSDDDKLYLGVYYTRTLKVVVERMLKDPDALEDAFTANDTLCKFYKKNTIITAGKYINVWRINNSTLVKTHEIEKHSHGTIAGGDKFTKVVSLDINTVDKEFVFVYSGILYKYSFLDKKTKKISSKSNLVCCAYDSQKNIVITTFDGKVYSLKKKNIVEFEKSSSFEVNKIISQEGYIIGSTLQGILYVWNKNGRLLQKITTDQNLLYDFSIQNMQVFIANNKYVFVYSILRKDVSRFNVNHVSNYVSFAKSHFIYNDINQIIIQDLISFQKKSKLFTSRTLNSFLVPESDKLCTLLDLPQIKYDVTCEGVDFRRIYRKMSKRKTDKHTFFNERIKGIVYDYKHEKLYMYNYRGGITGWDLKKKILTSEIWSSAQGKKRMHVTTAELSPDCRFLVFAVNCYGYLAILNLTTKKYVRVGTGEDATDNSKIKFAILRGKTYLFLTVGSSILIYNFDDLKQEKHQVVRLDKYKDLISSFAIVEDEERLITTDRTGRILIWDLMDLSQKNPDRFLLQLEKKSDIINDCAYHKELKKLVTVGSDVRIWSFD
ncbi:protein kinase [Candidatus Uabimicrobium sp. HlEnr_7]|uniref:serine/threonine-protein kinase n=1 Tax=Candidatus Uabimicrobium helgolandensis TaxID=3095367 RepID=UPI0035561B66